MASVKENQKSNKQGKLPVNKSKRNAIIAVVVVCAVVFGAAVGISLVQRSGYTLRNTVGLTSANLQVDNAMLSYYMYNKMYDMVNGSPEAYDEHGFDINKPLKKQIFNEKMTWFDYFMEFTVKDVKILLTFAEAAYKDGKGLSDLDIRSIDRDIAKMNTEAEDKGMSLTEYLRSRYGQGVTEDDVRRAMELSAIAEKQKIALMDSYTYTDEQIDTYYKDFRQQFVYTDVIFFSVVPDTADVEGATQMEIANARQKAKEEAQALLDCDSSDEFMGNLKTYIYDKFDEITAEKKFNKVFHEGYTYVKNNKMSSWLFSSTRENGDKTVIKFNDDMYTAVYVVKATYTDNTVSKTMRDIYMDDLIYGNREQTMAAANEVMNAYNNGGEEAFAKLASEKSDDSRYRAKEGLIENVEKASNAPYIDWLFSTDRRIGDTAIIEGEDGVHVVYFVGDGRIGWRNDVAQILRNTDYEAAYTELLEEANINAVLDVTAQVKDRA